MWNFIFGAYLVTDSVRRQTKANMTLLVFHFVILVTVHAVIQFYYQSSMLAANAFFGLFWMGSLALVIWMRGGWVLDALLTTYASTTNHAATALTRVLIGFFTVESFVNNCFSIIPVYGHLGGFGLMLASAASYFMFRHMAGKPIDWASWVWFPQLNLAVSIFVVLYHAYGKSMQMEINSRTFVWVLLAACLVGALYNWIVVDPNESKSGKGGH